MEVVVTGRHCEVSDRFRGHVSEKLSRLEKHDHRIMRVNVEVDGEDAGAGDELQHQVGPIAVTGEGPLLVREKTHQASPMTLDQALYEMELVGHDFYLFVDKESERPCVVYRRRGYDYGVIALELGPQD